MNLIHNQECHRARCIHNVALPRKCRLLLRADHQFPRSLFCDDNSCTRLTSSLSRFLFSGKSFQTQAGAGKGALHRQGEL